MFFGHTELGMWDLSSPTRGQIHTPCIGTLTLNHWATRNVPCFKFFCDKKKMIYYLSLNQFLLSCLWLYIFFQVSLFYFIYQCTV